MNTFATPAASNCWASARSWISGSLASTTPTPAQAALTTARPSRSSEKVTQHADPRDRIAERRAYLVLGGLLVLAGVAWLLARTAGVDLPALVAAVGWPVFVVVPGLVLLALGLSMPRQPGQGMAVGGTILSRPSDSCLPTRTRRITGRAGRTRGR